MGRLPSGYLEALAGALGQTVPMAGILASFGGPVTGWAGKFAGIYFTNS
jgi:hypothetical protein